MQELWPTYRLEYLDGRVDSGVCETLQTAMDLVVRDMNKIGPVSVKVRAPYRQSSGEMMLVPAFVAFRESATGEWKYGTGVDG